MAETERPDPFITEFSDERIGPDDTTSEAKDSIDGEIKPTRRPTTWFDCTRTLSDPFSNYGNGNSERDFF